MLKNVKSETVIFLALFIVAILVRLATAAALGISQEPVSDEIQYFQPAESFANGQGLLKIPQQSADGVAHPSAFRMPLPSMVIGIGLAVFGHKYMVARLISIVFGSFAAPLMYRFVGRFASWPAALLASLGVIFHPVLVFNTVLILSEPYFVTLMLLALDLSLRATESRNAQSGLWAGLAWGVAIMVKPQAAPMAFLIMLYLLARYSWKVAAGLSLGVVVLLVPWVVRNYVSLGHPVLLATEGGETFLGSNNPYILENPKTWGMWQAPMKIEEYRLQLLPINDEVERNSQQYTIAMAYLKANPDAIPKLVFRKLWRWFNPVTETPGMIRFAILGAYGALLILLAIGVFRGTFRSSPALHFVLLCTGVLIAVTIVFWGMLTRGRIALEILWMPWAAITAWNLIGSQFARRLPYDEGARTNLSIS